MWKFLDNWNEIVLRALEAKIKFQMELFNRERAAKVIIRINKHLIEFGKSDVKRLQNISQSDVERFQQDLEKAHGLALFGTRLLANFAFLLGLFCLNLSFLYVLYVFVPVSRAFSGVILLASFCFLSCIWFQERRLLNYRASMLGREMSKDLRNFVSGRRD